MGKRGRLETGRERLTTRRDERKRFRNLYVRKGIPKLLHQMMADGIPMAVEDRPVRTMAGRRVQLILNPGLRRTRIVTVERA